MKILFLTRAFYPHIGGVERHVLELSVRLIKLGHEVSLITEQHDKNIELFENYKHIKIYRVNESKDNKKKKFKIWNWLFKNKHLLIEADIIHCHDVFFWYFPFKFLFWKKPVFITFHGYESFPIKKRAIFIRKLSETLSLGNICVGDFIKKWYKTKPNSVIYGGVEKKEVTKRSKRHKLAVFIGRLDDQTGIITYYDAYRILKREFSDFNFTVIGEGVLKKYLKKGVILLGNKNSPWEFLEKNRFAFVSRYLSILEAMMVKRLVFAVYDNPVKEDYLKMAPFADFINIAGSAEELVKQVKYYIRNPKEEKRKTEKAHGWVSLQTWNNIVNVYLRLWGLKK